MGHLKELFLGPDINTWNESQKKYYEIVQEINSKIDPDFLKNLKFSLLTSL